jgi:hypothetical protein
MLCSALWCRSHLHCRNRAVAGKLSLHRCAGTAIGNLHLWAKYNNINKTASLPTTPDIQGLPDLHGLSSLWGGSCDREPEVLLYYIALSSAHQTQPSAGDNK